MRLVLRTGAILIVTALAAALSGGCGSDDDPVKPPPGNPAPTGPQAVLTRLIAAYQARDSVETKQVYDSSYVGTSQDLSDPYILTQLRYSDEVRHVAALARSTTIVSVSADFGPSSSWTRLPSDDVSHPEWALIQINSVHIQIYDGPTLYEVVSSNPMLFHFKPTVVAASDTTWRIVKWTEVGGGGP